MNGIAGEAASKIQPDETLGPGADGRDRASSTNLSHSIAAQISVLACPKVRMIVATFIAVSMSGALKMSR